MWSKSQQLCEWAMPAPSLYTVSQQSKSKMPSIPLGVAATVAVSPRPSLGFEAGCQAAITLLRCSW